MTTATIKKEVYAGTRPPCEVVYTDGDYNIKRRNITGRYLIDSTIPLNAMSRLNLSGSYSTLEEAQVRLESFKKNFA